MTMIWLYTFTSVLLVSLVSLVGAFFLSLNEGLLDRLLLFLVSFSAGALLGDAFIHLIPESVELLGEGVVFPGLVLFGILLFFILEKFICWRHCHIPTSADHPHPVAYMNLVGDLLHNFVDGMMIAGTFLISVPLGVVTSIAVLLHEVPQEIGDFGVLVYAGLSRTRALFLNFAVATSAFFGAFLVLAISVRMQSIASYIVPVTAGGFIYIAASDLIPELKKDFRPMSSVWQLAAIILGILLMFSLLAVE